MFDPIQKFSFSHVCLHSRCQQERGCDSPSCPLTTGCPSLDCTLVAHLKNCGMQLLVGITSLGFIYLFIDALRRIICFFHYSDVNQHAK